MNREQLLKLHLNQRVSILRLNKMFEQETIFGYVTKLYDDNYQIQVWFDAEPKPRVVGYTQIELVVSDSVSQHPA
jgi:hypothetical protein